MWHLGIWFRRRADAGKEVKVWSCKGRVHHCGENDSALPGLNPSGLLLFLVPQPFLIHTNPNPPAFHASGSALSTWLCRARPTAASPACPQPDPPRPTQPQPCPTDSFSKPLIKLWEFWGVTCFLSQPSLAAPMSERAGCAEFEPRSV